MKSKSILAWLWHFEHFHPSHQLHSSRSETLDDNADINNKQLWFTDFFWCAGVCAQSFWCISHLIFRMTLYSVFSISSFFKLWRKLKLVYKWGTWSSGTLKNLPTVSQLVHGSIRMHLRLSGISLGTFALNSALSKIASGTLSRREEEIYLCISHVWDGAQEEW